MSFLVSFIILLWFFIFLFFSVGGAVSVLLDLIYRKEKIEICLYMMVLISSLLCVKLYFLFMESLIW